MRTYKGVVVYTLLGAAGLTAAAQTAAFADDPNADWLPMPPAVAFTATASGTASLTATTAIAIPETILEDGGEYHGRLERYGTGRITVLKRASPPF